MRSSQWSILGIFLIAMSSWFIMMDNSFSGSCNVLDTSSTLNKYDIYACVSGEILDPFIWIMFPLALVFFVNGYIESLAEKRLKNRKKKK